MNMQPTYNLWLVALSVGMAIFVAYTVLKLTARSAIAHAPSALRWLIGGAVVLGIGIWSTHFIAMGGMPLDAASSSAVVGALTCALLTVALVAAFFDARLEARTQLHADELAAADLQLRHITMHDALTGLPNRTLLLDRLNQSILAAERCGGKFAVLTLNLDRFKTVNDSLGYGAGDELLRQVTHRLTGIVRADDTVARSGGDEFVVVMNRVHDMAEVESAARRVIQALGDPFTVHPQQVHTSPSIGISIFPVDGRTADLLLACSTESLRHAKKLGRNTYQFFVQGMSTFSQENFELESELRHALELKQFQLYYQPKIDVATDEIIGVEALLRWFHPRMGSIGPDRFIPLAEETGLILPIGEWIMREACQQARRWREAGLPFLRMAVNLSATQFQQSNLETVVRSALQDAELEPQVLELELTESSVMTNPEESAVILEKLSAAGVLVAIDDFGKGYSSMSYLQRFPIDKLKIDRSFIKDLTVNANSAAIVTAVISLAHSLRLKVVAEGVESYGQLAHLRQVGCDHYQGYLCSRAVPADELEELVRAKKARRALPTTHEAESLRTHSRLATYSPATCSS